MKRKYTEMQFKKKKVWKSLRLPLYIETVWVRGGTGVGGGRVVEKATKRNHRFRKCWWGVGVYAVRCEGRFKTNATTQSKLS